MGFFDFLRKKEDSALTKLRNIENSLVNSFSHIRNDISKIYKDQRGHKHMFHNIMQRLEHLEERISDMKFMSTSSKLEEPKEEIIESEEELKKRGIKWEDLTETQQAIFKTLAIIQLESSQKWVSMKSVAEELYPNKKYNSVRSMVSDYINLLTENGLVKKMRKNRQTYISITKKGLNYFDKKQRKKLVSVINK